VIKAILFDMDGVLVDSPGFVWEVYNSILREHDKQVSDEDIPKYLGKRLVEQIELLKEDYQIPLSSEEFKKIFDKRHSVETSRIKKTPGLPELMEKLKQLDLKLALVTSSGKDRALNLIKFLDIENYFDTLVTAVDVKVGKPDPEGYLKAAKKLNVSPEDCIVIEDAVNGIEAGKNAGMKVIALETKYQKREALGKSDYIITSLNEIIDIIDKENKS